ncbi:MAG: IS3 family transposase [Zhenhengia sp.]|uniref:IS3 family transposase n=1 Tax=Zhenhengia sp. TaxID=2944208 RepID=UPI00399103E2
MSKYSYEQKLKIVLFVVDQHHSIEYTSKYFGVPYTPIKRWVKRYEIHGAQGLVMKKHSYSGDFKQHVIEYMHENHLSFMEAAALFGIPSETTISKWSQIYHKEGPQALYRENRGRSRNMPSNKQTKPNPSQMSNEELLNELEYLRMENEYFKKVKCLNSGEGSIGEKDKILIVSELRHTYKLSKLLKLSGIPHSTYYYHLKRLKQPDKYSEVKEIIKQLYDEHCGRYGYRRITLELKHKGYNLNHKTVLKLMKQLALKSMVRIKKYKSYKGNVGKIAPNIFKRDFKATKPNEKWATDVTEFSLFGKKLYLSPIIDLFNGEIVSYNISERPTFHQTIDMLNKAFKKIPDDTGLILHSDQGWQYQMKHYQKLLRDKGIVQSMSRKGNCLDNAVIENFFGVLKSELFYLQDFHSIEHFKEELENYIEYYNHKRIKSKLKGLSPVQYRIQSLLVT